LGILKSEKTGKSENWKKNKLGENRVKNQKKKNCIYKIIKLLKN
jgi:hypothetical protein